MKYLIRLIVVPFFWVIIFIHLFIQSLKVSWQFIRHGGEVSSYAEDDKTTMKDIYLELKQQRKQ